MSDLAVREKLLELDSRESSGLKVELLYKKVAKEVLLHLVNEVEDFEVAFPVSPEKARNAFDHPYAYYQEFLGSVALQAA